ncbi:MAG: hypothetical protein MUF04_12610, partial [Akkermansiaceae bacterium]|nr:hypothetical protein [Akkermansiaceae bacterium]
MGADNGSAKAQPNAKSIGFGGAKPFEQPGRHGLRNSGSGIVHTQLDAFAVQSPCGDRDHLPLGRAVGACVEGIAHQVLDDLFHLDRIGKHRRQVGPEFGHQAALPVCGFGLKHVEDFPDEGVAIER